MAARKPPYDADIDKAFAPQTARRPLRRLQHQSASTRPAEVLADGVRAGRLAADHAGFAASEVGTGGRIRHRGSTTAYPIIRHPQGEEFVDFDEDLHLARHRERRRRRL